MSPETPQMAALRREVEGLLAIMAEIRQELAAHRLMISEVAVLKVRVDGIFRDSEEAQKRLGSMDRFRWLLTGGGIAILTLLGWAISILQEILAKPLH